MRKKNVCKEKIVKMYQRADFFQTCKFLRTRRKIVQIKNGMHRMLSNF